MIWGKVVVIMDFFKNIGWKILPSCKNATVSATRSLWYTYKVMNTFICTITCTCTIMYMITCTCTWLYMILHDSTVVDVIHIQYLCI